MIIIIIITITQYTPSAKSHVLFRRVGRSTVSVQLRIFLYKCFVT